jgi:hypothetical protein
MSMSTGAPALGVGISSRSLAPRRISALTSAIGPLWECTPPSAIVAPSGMPATASSGVVTLFALIA